MRSAVTSHRWGHMVRLLLFALFVLSAGANVAHTFVLPDRTHTADFGELVAAARYGLAHGWSHAYDPSYGLRHNLEAGKEAAFAPLPAYWLVVPLAVLPYDLASALWVGVLAVLLMGAFWLTAPARREWRVLYVAGVAGLYTIGFTLHLGQTTAIVAFLLAVSWRLLQRDRDLLAGLVLGLSVIKPQVLICVPLAMLLSRRWRFAAGWAISAGALALVTSVALGPDGTARYVDYLLTRAIGYSVAYTTGGFLDLAFLHALPPRPAEISIRFLALALVVIAAVWAGPRRPSLALVAGVLGSCVVAVYLRFQDFLSLNLAAAILLGTLESPFSIVVAVWSFVAASALLAGVVLVPDVVQVGLWITLEWVWLVGLVLALRPRPRAAPDQTNQPKEARAG